MDAKYRSRKFMLAVMIYIAATALAAYKILDGAQVMAIYLTILGAYSLANVAEKKAGVE